MVRGDILILQSVDEQHRSLDADDCLFRRGCFHIQTVAKANVKESDIDGGPEESSS